MPTSPHPDPEQQRVADLVASLMRDIPDFPQPGVLFKDFTPLLADGAALVQVVDDVAPEGPVHGQSVQEHDDRSRPTGVLVLDGSHGQLDCAHGAPPPARLDRSF